MEDVLLIDKPKGITSFDCIRILRKELGIRKMGHAGTLDPLASGLMIIGINKGTKKLNEYLKLPKVYVATILLGVSTDTGDMEGVVEDKQLIESDTFSDKQIEEVVAEMKGVHSLFVPKYSAIKKEGKPLYKYAREGKEVEVPVRDMVVRDTKLLSIELPEIQAEFDVESGVYIRSLAEELGRKLGVPATLSGLRRISIGDFSIQDAQKLPEQTPQTPR